MKKPDVGDNAGSKFPRTEHLVETLSNKVIVDCGALISHER
ncbi:hypothetical protein [Mesorhizobium sp. M7A.F.Ca.US.010.02.1.1]|nr:hypothetical protein [Mesorhizobium sp. M7A.F.Ca.US.010.02.1.1]